ncbi:transcription factor 21 [Striga asiatica]|uniref:Transcription factor 21 n=1 Tax=Striga asiatica TaxID=4170 RepID=A0A5A7R3F0_STRAF|nr:transcription factor 21 [Striga asiatica]
MGASIEKERPSIPGDCCAAQSSYPWAIPKTHLSDLHTFPAKTNNASHIQTHRTILSDQRVIGCAEVHEPIPVAGEPQEGRNPVQRRRQHCGTAVSYQTGLPHDPHVPHAREHRVVRHEFRDLAVLRFRRGGVHVDEVVVRWVVEGQEEPLEADRVAGGGGYEVALLLQPAATSTTHKRCLYQTTDNSNQKKATERIETDQEEKHKKS